MTGDDSYHAHCFKCKICKSRIDELVFAKTSQGIYCMNCHSDRMIKIRKHAQKKAEREKVAGGGGSTKPRERNTAHYHKENGVRSVGCLWSRLFTLTPNQASDIYHSAPRSHAPKSSLNPQPSSALLSDFAPSLVKSSSGQYVSDAFEPSPWTSPSAATSQVKTLPSLASISSSQSISVTVAPPQDSGYIHPEYEQYPSKSISYLDHHKPSTVKQNTLPLPQTATGIGDGRRRSFDDGVRPLDVLFARKGDSTQHLSEVPLTAPATSKGLDVANSRRDKRHSINPGVSSSDFNAIASVPAISPTLSSSFPSQQPSAPPTPLASPHWEQSNPHSPSSRPASDSGSRLSHLSLHLSSSAPHTEARQQERPQPSTPSMHPIEQDQTIVVRPSPPSTVILDSAPLPRPRARIRPVDEPSILSVEGHTGRSSLSANLDPKDVDVLRAPRSLVHQRQPVSRSHPGRLSDPSQARSRSISPAYRADVPQNIESETDTEAESDSGGQRSHTWESVPPDPPQKEDSELLTEITDVDSETPISIQPDNGSEDTESSTVEHTSHSTFIAPALPPIRFSMNTADFSELFNSVGGMPSLKAINHLAELSEELHGNYTPSPTANFEIETNLTPTSNVTMIPGIENDSRGDSEAAGKRSSSSDASDDRSADRYVHIEHYACGCMNLWSVFLFQESRILQIHTRTTFLLPHRPFCQINPSII
jgi:hypothetical protein